MNEDSIELLKAAKERLFTTGWLKGDLGEQEGPNCILGALYRERTSLECKNNVFTKTVNSLYNCPGIIGIRGVADFNDDENTTFDDIVDLLDKTVKSLEGGK